MISGLGQDLKLAARRLAAAPLFTTFAVVSIAVGIGVTTIAISIVDTVFFRRLRMPDATRVALVVTAQARQAPLRSVLSPADFADLREAKTDLAALAASWQLSLSFTTPAETRLALAEAVTAEYFETAGVVAALGRVLSVADYAQALPVAVISDRFWRERFSADQRAIGSMARIGGRTFEIVGVLPASYEGLPLLSTRHTEIWLPLSTGRFIIGQQRGTPNGIDESLAVLSVIGRLSDGQTIDRASVEIQSIGAALDAVRPLPAGVSGAPTRNRGWTAQTLSELHADFNAPARRIGFIVAGLVLLVWVVACTNLANLVLARGHIRHQEFAIRLALGAPRWRVVREQLAESLLIAAVGGVAAALVMRVLVALYTQEISLTPWQTIALRPSVDLNTLVSAAIALLLSLVIFGLEPALQLSRRGRLRGLGASASDVAPRGRRHRLMLRWQVAASTAFFIITAIMTRYVFVEARHDPGIAMDHLVVAQLDLGTQQWSDGRAQRVIQEVLQGARSQAGLASTAISTALPFGTMIPSIQVSRVERPFDSAGTYPGAKLIMSTPDFFNTVGLRILRGKAFDDSDVGPPRSVLINESTARLLFQSLDVVGQPLLVRRTSPEASVTTVTIIGVVNDTDSSYMASMASPLIFAPLSSDRDFTNGMIVVGRSDQPEIALTSMRGLIRKSDPDVAIVRLGRARSVLTGPYEFLRFASNASMSLGLLTLGMSMLGLYGIQAQVISHRTREIGVRLALGASATRIRVMMLKEGYRSVFEGLLIGLGAGTAGRLIIRAYLDASVSAVDAWMWLIVPLPILLSAFCACYFPARTASKIDASVALRHI